MGLKKVAVIGARGIANYGGFETLVSELAPRLRERGFEVLCSHRWVDKTSLVKEFRGVKLEYFPFRFPQNVLLSRIFELLYDSYFLLMCSFGLKCDIVYCLGTGVGFALPIAKLSGSKTIVNTDGLEWKRAKFGMLQRSFIRLLFHSCYLFADDLVIDNSRLMDFIPMSFRNKAVFIPYGVSMPERPSWNKETVESCAWSKDTFIEPKGYWLVVARLEPDNNIHTIVKAYSESRTKKPLLVVGSFASSKYEARVSDILGGLEAGKRVIFAGPIFNRNQLTMVRCHSFAYVHGHSVGGTNPSLLEAMSVGSPIIAHDNAFNREVCGGSALYFRDATDLARLMDLLEGDNQMPSRLGSQARSIAHSDYRWETVVDSYEQLFLKA